MSTAILFSRPGGCAAQINRTRWALPEVQLPPRAISRAPSAIVEDQHVILTTKRPLHTSPTAMLPPLS
ncbi:hypothetical protein MRX96_004032 [Rhipicephalus microplus]